MRRLRHKVIAILTNGKILLHFLLTYLSISCELFQMLFFDKPENTDSAISMIKKVIDEIRQTRRIN